MQTIDNDLSHKLGAQSDTQIYLKSNLIVYKATHYMWHICFNRTDVDSYYMKTFVF